jgi:peptidyl-prolyl cis-trans isomerase B (cyclophilin B)
MVTAGAPSAKAVPASSAETWRRGGPALSSGAQPEETTMKTATIETDRGTIQIELFEKDAPGTVANFETLAKKGFYDGLTFHRVIADFMIQGGCPKGTGTGGPGYNIKCETRNNPRKHGKGALSMAHAGKDTGGSQFFITHRATPHLDGVHTVFGQVTSGQEVVDAIRVGDRMKKVTVA